LPSPIEAYFEVANRCTRFAHCPLTFSPQESAKNLGLAELERLVDSCRICGGGATRDREPCSPRAAGDDPHLKSRGVYVLFNTNAALLTHRRQVELIESGLTSCGSRSMQHAGDLPQGARHSVVRRVIETRPNGLHNAS